MKADCLILVSFPSRINAGGRLLFIIHYRCRSVSKTLGSIRTGLQIEQESNPHFLMQKLYFRAWQQWLMKAWRSVLPLNPQKTYLDRPGILSRVPNNDQVLGSTWIATAFLHVPHHYQHEVNETNHVHKIITIMEKWSGVPHFHAGGNGNQAIKFNRPNRCVSRAVALQLYL